MIFVIGFLYFSFSYKGFVFNLWVGVVGRLPYCHHVYYTDVNRLFKIKVLVILLSACLGWKLGDENPGRKSGRLSFGSREKMKKKRDGGGHVFHMGRSTKTFPLQIEEKMREEKGCYTFIDLFTPLVILDCLWIFFLQIRSTHVDFFFSICSWFSNKTMKILHCL